MKRVMNLTWVVILLAASVGCGDDGTSFAGVYEITSWTETSGGCGEVPVDVMSGDTGIFLKDEGALFGLHATLCADESTCRDEFGSEDIFLSGWFFTSGNDDDGYVGDSWFLFEDGMTGLCDGSVMRATMTFPSATSMTIEVRSYPATDVPLDGDGFCDTDNIDQYTDFQSCEEIEVLQATAYPDPA